MEVDTKYDLPPCRKTTHDQYNQSASMNEKQENQTKKIPNGTGGVETWGWDEHFAMWQYCYRKLFQHIKYLSLVMWSLPFSCFEVMSHSWWTSNVLFPGVQLNLSRSDSHHCFAKQQNRVFARHTVATASSFPSAWFLFGDLRGRISQADGQRYYRMCLDIHTARAKVTKLLSKSFTNLDPPVASQA